MAMSGFPAPPTGINVNATEARGWGPGYPNCQYDKVVRVTLSNGVVLHVRREVAELLRLVLNECVRRGYAIRQKDTGAFNCRAIAGTTRPSNHSWALAVDINWNSNPMGQKRTDIPVWMVSLLWSFGFFWGGWYDDSNIDTMHFEYVGTPSRALADTKRAQQELGGIQVGTVVDLNAVDGSQLFNAASAIGHIGLMHDEAPHRQWQGANAGKPAAPLALPIVGVIREIQDGVKTLVARPAPSTDAPVVGEFTLADADVERIATRVAELLAERLAD